MKTLSPQTIGLDQPRPGTGVFQATFSLALQVSGSRGSSATTDVPSGPRNCGQLSDSAAARICRQNNAASSATVQSPGSIRFFTMSLSMCLSASRGNGRKFTTPPRMCQQTRRAAGRSPRDEL